MRGISSKVGGFFVFVGGISVLRSCLLARGSGYEDNRLYIPLYVDCMGDVVRREGAICTEQWVVVA